jgi:hypothetical protein
VTQPGPVEELLLERAAGRVARKGGVPSAPPPSQVAVVAAPVRGGPARDLWAGPQAARALGPSSAAAPSSNQPLQRWRLAVASAGASYHPELDAHQAALREEVDRLEAAARKTNEARARLPPPRNLTAKERRAALRAAALDSHDPDESDEEEGGEKKKAAAPALSDAAAAASAAPAPAPAKKVKKLRSSKKQRAEREAFAAKVVAAVADLNAVPAPVPRATKAPMARADTGAPVAPAVPLSEELTGSLRGMKPVAAGLLVVEHLQVAAARGLAHRRNARYAESRVEEGWGSGKPRRGKDGEEEDKATVTVLSKHQLDRIKGKGNPWKVTEFPRKREFDDNVEGVFKGAAGEW